MVDIKSLMVTCLKVGHQNDVATKKTSSSHILCAEEADATNKYEL